MRSKAFARIAVCLCAALVCAVFGVAAVSNSNPSAGVSKPSFDLSLQGGVYSLNARDAALNEILEQLAAVSGARFQIADADAAPGVTPRCVIVDTAGYPRVEARSCE